MCVKYTRKEKFEAFLGKERRRNNKIRRSGQKESFIKALAKKGGKSPHSLRQKNVCEKWRTSKMQPSWSPNA